MTRKASQRAGFERVFGQKIGQSRMSVITVGVRLRQGFGEISASLREFFKRMKSVEFGKKKRFKI
jgi:hypothetical protein